MNGWIAVLLLHIASHLCMVYLSKIGKFDPPGMLVESTMEAHISRYRIGVQPYPLGSIQVDMIHTLPT